ncbi:MAG: thiamine diphosphokinase [Lachnospiraceae bacterium]
MSNHKKAIIISGGMLEDEFVLSVMKANPESYIIGVDRGASFLYKYQIMPDYIVGDFDSLSEEIIHYYRTETKVPIREFNPIKDASDTEVALRLALSIGSKEILILGATGNRIDHLWANVQILMIAHKAGVTAWILDMHNRIHLIDGETHLKKEEAFGQYFSVFPLGEKVEDFDIRGAKYPLYSHVLEPCNSLCVSNEILQEEAVITFARGIVILMETRDHI